MIWGILPRKFIFQEKKKKKNRRTQHKPPSKTSQKEEKLGSRTKVEPIVKPIMP